MSDLIDYNSINEYERDHLERLRPYLPECTVLLKYGGQFPVDAPCKVALYGAGARNTVKGGTGSGEVNSRFFITVEQGLKDRGFTVTTSDWIDPFDQIRQKAHKQFVKEVKARARRKKVLPAIEGMGAIMPEPEYDIPLSATGDIAVYVLSRISGEGADREYRKGDILLTDSEVRDILELNRVFNRFMLVLNTGGPVDLTPVMEVKNILLLSQLGVETGYVLADILLGKSYPSGKLATTWSVEEDYCKEGTFGDRDDTYYNEGIYVGYRYFDSAGKEPVFPFGYGLGFTSFSLQNADFTVEGQTVRVMAKVSNTGGFPGKETLQLYVSIPSGRLDQPYQTLAAFAKTGELKPGEDCEVELFFDMSEIASYDEKSSSYVLESGDYILRLGTSSRDTGVIGAVRLEESVTVKKVDNLLGEPGFRDYVPESVSTSEQAGKVICIDPGCIPCTSVSYDDVSFDVSRVEGLTDEELCYLSIGAFEARGGLTSAVGNSGKSVAGAAGQTAQMLENKGIGSLCMADGPAGVRISRNYVVRDGKVLSLDMGIPDSMQDYIPKIAFMILKLSGVKPRKGEEIRHQYCTAIPVGTAVAQSWNTDFAYVCGDVIGSEMELYNVDLWLAPALNIHRDIRCGRNFEYYSEDPLISGVMAMHMTRGVQSHKGRGVTIKHFAANNQETNRYNSNSRVSERAMREIYLRGFEICVRGSQPRTVMTSYNLLNGTHTSENRALIKSILRKEFGFDGVVMTDWVFSGGTMDKTSIYPAPESYKVAKAGGDLFMPGSKHDYDNLLNALKNGAVTREQLMINVSRIVKIMDRRSTGQV
ncbi:beta-glucosidase [Ruminococcaceae bacterium YRB3002]|nr:beta-glucosidase [Ruminococcaceae bacterium YRB3002]